MPEVLKYQLLIIKLKTNFWTTNLGLFFNNVIGAASKLFKYFISNYDVDIISSYADISHTL